MKLLWLKSLKGRPTLTSESEGHLPSPAHRPSAPSPGFLGRPWRQLAPARGRARRVGGAGEQSRKWGHQGVLDLRPRGIAAPSHSRPGLSLPSLVPVCPSLLFLCPLGCGRLGPGSAQLHVFPGKRINRTLQWPRPIPVSSPNRRVQGLGLGLGVSIWGW